MNKLKNLPNIPTNISTTKILVTLLVVAAFLLGSLYTKVSYLEKGTSALGISQVPQAPAAPSKPQAAAPAGKIKPVSNADHVRGNKNAKIAIVEYGDLECPFCKSFHPTMKEILQTYGDKVNWVYRHFPLSFHANAQKEGEASECVAELGGNDAFWSYIDKIYEKTTSNGTGFALSALGPLAAEVGVNQPTFQNCLDSGKYTQHVKDDIADGTTGGVSGTPSTFIVDSNGKSQIIVGAQPIDAFKTVIDQALK